MYCANQRIAIYPVDSVIQPLNNRGLITNALSRLIFSCRTTPCPIFPTPANKEMISQFFTFHTFILKQFYRIVQVPRGKSQYPFLPLDMSKCLSSETRGLVPCTCNISQKLCSQVHGPPSQRLSQFP